MPAVIQKQMHAGKTARVGLSLSFKAQIIEDVSYQAGKINHAKIHNHGPLPDHIQLDFVVSSHAHRARELSQLEFRRVLFRSHACEAISALFIRGSNLTTIQFDADSHESVLTRIEHAIEVAIAENTPFDNAAPAKPRQQRRYWHGTKAFDESKSQDGGALRRQRVVEHPDVAEAGIELKCARRLEHQRVTHIWGPGLRCSGIGADHSKIRGKAQFVSQPELSVHSDRGVNRNLRVQQCPYLRGYVSRVHKGNRVLEEKILEPRRKQIQFRIQFFHQRWVAAVVLKLDLHGAALHRKHQPFAQHQLIFRIQLQRILQRSNDHFCRIGKLRGKQIAPDAIYTVTGGGLVGKAASVAAEGIAEVEILIVVQPPRK